jgi:hypothetical protein
VSDAAVRKATGKGLNEWFSLLDQAGAVKCSHRSIADWINKETGIPGWWCQSVTLAYERARGLRVQHQKCDGLFAASASRTIQVGLPALFAAWLDEDQRRSWLGSVPLVVRKWTDQKYLRCVWSDGDSRVNVNFYPKGESKAAVSIDHERITNLEQAHAAKAYWREALNRLQGYLEVKV